MSEQMTWQEVMKQLQAPFHPDDIEWRVGATTQDKSKGIALAYVTNRAIQNRLDEIFGPFGWRNEFKEWKGDSQLCGLSVKWEGEWITKWDGADDSKEEAVKGGLSDSMKRAGYQWGIGRYLYKLENIWVPLKPAGKSYRLAHEPQLPKWALPEGYKTKGGNTPVEEVEITEDSLPQELVGKIQTIILEKGYTKNALKKKIKELFNVEDIALLTLDQGNELYDKVASLPNKSELQKGA